ncbi:MAG: flagellum-specific ATP synthase FliI, partial [Hyphococcus sp.]
MVYPAVMEFSEIIKGSVEPVAAQRRWGRVKAIEGGVIHVAGLNGAARIGDRVRIGGDANASGEVIAIRDDHLLAMPEAALKGMSPGDRAYLWTDDDARPSRAWIGSVLSSTGEYFDGSPAPQGGRPVPLNPPPLPVTERRSIGQRLNTGLAPFDTFLPLCRGQRIGLFAGAGVGKSSLLGDLAKGVDADVIVIALIGERSREVREFIDDVLDDEGRRKTIVIASTCDDPAPSKRRGALLALSTAEYFRDQGLHVLLLFDSITRFADAHREIALTAGETPSLRAYPPSTFRAIAS